MWIQHKLDFKCEKREEDTELGMGNGGCIWKELKGEDEYVKNTKFSSSKLISEHIKKNPKLGLSKN